MKAVILAGGLGTRLSEETVNRPAIIGIRGRWIMKPHSRQGIRNTASKPEKSLTSGITANAL